MTKVYKIIFSLIFLLTASEQVFAEDYRQVLNLNGIWKFTIGDDPAYALPEYNDLNWDYLQVPGIWENQGFNGYDGYAWYRTSFDGSTLNAVEFLYLNLGYIDDVDEVYLNGELIGMTGSFPPNFYTAYRALRRYAIPKELINTSGENTIAVRVYDVVHEGGIVSGNIGIEQYLNIPSGMINLAGLWKFKTISHMIYRHPDADDMGWEYKMVPGYWKEKHIKGGEAFAWYRKKFTLGEEADKNDWVLVLGRIDDFDEVYINGKFVGETNDGLPFGMSGSWRKVRAYPIENGVLQKGENLIAVRVEDMGLDAGIYQGPVGLVPKENLEQVLRLF